MKWKPVKGPGDLQRGISYPTGEPASAKLRRASNPYILYNEFDHMLSEAKGRMARAAYAQKSKAETIRDPYRSEIRAQRTPTKRSPGLPWITHKKPKPQSVLKPTYQPGAAGNPAKKRG